MRVLTFLRHVQSQQNEGLPHGPNRQIQPTATGVVQLEALRYILPGVKHIPKPDRIDSSPFDRTILTAASAQHAYPGTKILLDKDLGEFTPFDIAHGEIITAKEKYPALSHYRQNTDPGYRMEPENPKLVTGETFNEFMARIDGYMNRVLQQGDLQSLMPVTHGNWLRVMTLHVRYPKRNAATLLQQMNKYSVPYNPDAVQLVYDDGNKLLSMKHYMFSQNFALPNRYPVLKTASGNKVKDVSL